jgi:prolyl 4-hydroxylase
LALALTLPLVVVVDIAHTQDEKIIEIEEKVAMLTGIPVVNGEDMQVLRYEHLQKYAAHNDYFPTEYLSENDGMQRTATILLYLTDVDKGGETHFPRGLPLKDYAGRHTEDVTKFSACAKRKEGKLHSPTTAHASVIPKRGDALLFYSMDPSNQLVDPVSSFSIQEGLALYLFFFWHRSILCLAHRVLTTLFCLLAFEP